MIKNIKTIYESWEKFIKFFNDHSKIASKAKYRTIHGQGRPSPLTTQLKILTPEKMFQRLPIALAQVKVGNTSENEMTTY